MTLGKKNLIACDVEVLRPTFTYELDLGLGNVKYLVHKLSFRHTNIPDYYCLDH